MTDKEFVERIKGLLDYDTLYVNGGWGWPLDSANKNRALMNSYNAQPLRAYKIEQASRFTFAFDCVCMIKAVLWGWSGSYFDHNGGAKYAANGVPDINADRMISECGERYDWDHIVPGAVVWMKGHIGVYVGDGFVVEATPIWADGVQMTALNAPKAGYNWRKWTCWGLLPWVEYQPEDAMTYDDFKLFMHRYEAERKSLAADEYASEALEWAKANGISVGDAAGNLMPQAYVKRQDVVLMLYRAEKQHGK